MPYVYGGDIALLNFNRSDAIIQGGLEALEALRGFLDEHPELEIAELNMGENMPIKALLSSEFSHDWFIWAPAGWVRL